MRVKLSSYELHVLTNIQNLVGSAFDDTLTGNSAKNVLPGEGTGGTPTGR